VVVGQSRDFRARPAARNDEALSTALIVATPGDDAGLEAGIQALAKILAANKGKLSPDSQADQRLSEVDGLCSALQSSPGILQTRKGQTVADTTQIDLSDGRLCVWIRDINRAARQAIRSGHLHASLHEYALHHLKQSGNPVPKPVPAPRNRPPRPRQLQRTEVRRGSAVPGRITMENRRSIPGAAFRPLPNWASRLRECLSPPREQVSPVGNLLPPVALRHPRWRNLLPPVAGSPGLILGITGDHLRVPVASAHLKQSANSCSLVDPFLVD
jgi:hypothetical protein